MKNYLIYGENIFMIKNWTDKIVKSINEESNVIKYNMEETTIEQVLEEANTFDLFGNKKIVILENCVFLSTESKKNSDYNMDLLIQYLNNPNPDCSLVITFNSNIDERKKISKELKKLCETKIFNNMDNNEIYSYVKSKLESSSYIIDNKSIDLLIKKIGTNLMQIDNELEKLMMYKLDDKKISIHDIEEVISENIQDSIFDLVDSVMNNDKKRIFYLYNRIVNINNEEPTKIIVILANQFRLILQSKILFGEGLTEPEIASKLKVHPYRVKLALQKYKNMDTKKIFKYLDDLSSLDINIKSGNTNKNIGLELFFLNM